MLVRCQLAAPSTPLEQERSVPAVVGQQKELLNVLELLTAVAALTPCRPMWSALVPRCRSFPIALLAARSLLSALPEVGYLAPAQPRQAHHALGASLPLGTPLAVTHRPQPQPQLEGCLALH